MSKQSHRHPLMMRRLMGYITPLVVFIALTLWFRPQNEIGWVAVLFGTLLSTTVSFATLTQARSEVARKRHPQKAETISIMEPRLPADATFSGPYGGMRSHEQPMDYWLDLQPPVTTP